MIIAVDFDGTIQLKNAGKPEPNLPLIRKLIAAQRSGHIVILWTCRNGKSLSEAVSFCMAHGFRPNYVNQNCPQAIRMFGGDTRKIYADVYIDDKAVSNDRLYYG